MLTMQAILNKMNRDYFRRFIIIFKLEQMFYGNIANLF